MGMLLERDSFADLQDERESEKDDNVCNFLPTLIARMLAGMTPVKSNKLSNSQTKHSSQKKVRNGNCSQRGCYVYEPVGQQRRHSKKCKEEKQIIADS
jgi:hypothetical protein